MVKNKNTALLLCVFFGYFGAHKFYEGKMGMGILYFLTFGIFGIGWIADIILLIQKPEKYIVERKNVQVKNRNYNNNNLKLHCKRCGSENVSVQLDVVTESYGGRSEIRKKSAITNIGNSAGRAGMALMTGGLWLLTPKKSKYNEVQIGNVKTKKIKTAVCQDCGKSWRIY